MATEFKSHIYDTLDAIRENTHTVLSAPYAAIEDAMEDAPECALVFVSREGCYQHMVCDCQYGMPQIRELARGVYECSDLSLIAWRNRGFWENAGE
jgi:hypothetical protein